MKDRRLHQFLYFCSLRRRLFVERDLELVNLGRSPRN